MLSSLRVHGVIHSGSDTYGCATSGDNNKSLRRSIEPSSDYSLHLFRLLLGEFLSHCDTSLQQTKAQTNTPDTSTTRSHVQATFAIVNFKACWEVIHLLCLVCACPLVPSEGTTPKGVIVEKVRAAAAATQRRCNFRLLLLRRSNQRTQKVYIVCRCRIVEKGLELVVVQHHHSRDRMAAWTGWSVVVT